MKNLNKASVNSEIKCFQIRTNILDEESLRGRKTGITLLASLLDFTNKSMIQARRRPHNVFPTTILATIITLLRGVVTKIPEGRQVPWS